MKHMASPHPLVFDRRLLRARRRRAAALGPSMFLLERAAEDLSDRLAAVLRRFECALDLGTPTDALRRVLAASGKVGTIIAADALAGAGARLMRPSPSPPTRRRCRSATLRSISSCRRWRCSSSTICRVR